MAAAPRTHPRLAGDTYRTFLTLGLLMVGSVVIGFGYGMLSRRYGLPIGDVSYFSGASLLGFVIYFVLYQVLTWLAFHGGDADELARWARATTPHSRSARRLQAWTGTGVRSWAVTAALLALAAVVAVLVVGELQDNPLVLIGSLLVVISSWTMVVYTFAVAYLRLDADHGGLDFPGGDRPVWSDYVYLAVQVSATFSSSDVDASSPAARRLVTTHTLLAFVFNTVILALLVSALLTLTT